MDQGESGGAGILIFLFLFLDLFLFDRIVRWHPALEKEAGCGTKGTL